MIWIRRISAALALCVSAMGLDGQERSPAEGAYLMAVSEFFGVPSRELSILTEGGLDTEELPVALYVAMRSGISPEAVIVLREAGAPWNAIASRYGVDAAALYLPLPDDASAGALGALYERYRATPVEGWAGLPLEAADVVTLVNVRVLSQTLGIAPADVLASAGASPSFVVLYGELIR